LFIYHSKYTRQKPEACSLLERAEGGTFEKKDCGYRFALYLAILNLLKVHLNIGGKCLRHLGPAFMEIIVFLTL
jgi:hypothetical protein